MTPRLLLSSLVLVTLGACAHAPGSARSGALQAPRATPPSALRVAQQADAAGAEPDRRVSCAEGEHVLDCAVRTPGPLPHLMDMAVSGRFIGLAWTTYGNPWQERSESGSAYFEIIDEQLELVHRGVIPGVTVRDVAVAPWRSGWVVATGDGSTTVVRHIGPDGSTVGSLLRLEGAGAPHLAVSPSGEVLLTRTGMLEGAHVVRAALLTGLDEPPRWDVTVVESPTEPRFGSVVAIDGGFLVAQRGRAGVEIVHLDRRGQIGARHSQVGSSTEYPQLGSCGRDATMVWADFSAQGQMRWAALDRHGRSSTEPVTLGQIPDSFNPSPVLCDRHGSIVLLGGHTGGTGLASHLELTRVGGAGRAGERLPVLEGPQRVYDWRLDRLGDDVLVGWIELPGSIGLARLRTPRSAPADLTHAR